MLSLGLLLPFGTGTVTDGVAKTLASAAAPVPAKHVTLVRDGTPQALETRAATVEDVLAENGIVRTPEDAVSVDPQSAVVDGETIDFHAAVPVTIVVDGRSITLRSAAASVGQLLTAQGVAWDEHDKLNPQPAAPLAAGETVAIEHVNAWTESVRQPIAPKVVTRPALGLQRGRTKVVDAGRPGMRVIDYAFFRTPDRRGVRRTTLASRLLRAPQPKIVAEGIGDYAALTALAERGVEKTLRLATSALTMVATAYTAGCSGCSGITASGRPAGHGIVAVDPSIIPLGTRMYIPGYGEAVAGDTGGAIHGNRIDLGFNSYADAISFGRRAVTVYLLK